ERRPFNARPPRRRHLSCIGLRVICKPSPACQPVASDGSLDPEPRPCAAVAPDSRGVLLVEDDVSLRRSLCEFLHDHGFTTYSAGSNREAWQIIKSLRPSLC